MAAAAALLRPLFRLAVTWEAGEEPGKAVPLRSRRKLPRPARSRARLGRYTLAKEPSRRPLARLVFADHPRSAGQPPGERRTHRSLQINAKIVALSPQCMAQSADLSQRLSPSGERAHSFAFTKCVRSTKASRRLSTEKRTPARLDRPTQIPLRMGPAAKQSPPAWHAEYRPSRPAAQSGRGTAHFAVTRADFLISAQQAPAAGRGTALFILHLDQQARPCAAAQPRSAAAAWRHRASLRPSR